VAEPCTDWPIDPACTFGIDPNPGTRPAAQTYAVKVATELLWRLTAGIYGTCPLTVRPCGKTCQGFVEWWPSQLPDGRWINIACACEDSTCSCCRVCEIPLEGPVASVTQVKIDGVVVDSAAYRVDNGNELVRVDGEECWPTCQNLSLPDTQVDTFSITYERGLPVPVGGSRATAALAAEIIKSCASSPCRLPSRVQEIVRQGERIQLINDVDFLKSGLTGLPEVDQWVTAVNPYGHRSKPTVWSPDLKPDYRYQTWP
jgi:hypothetical protein